MDADGEGSRNLAMMGFIFVLEGLGNWNISLMKKGITERHVQVGFLRKRIPYLGLILLLNIVPPARENKGSPQLFGVDVDANFTQYS
jgi:hypothetical protein